MALIKHQKPLPHVLVPDTSFIWHENKGYISDPLFDEFWEKYASDFNFELRLPEIVKGELIFQQVTSAVKSLKRANQSMAEIENVTKRKYSHRVTEARIKGEVQKKLDKWLKAKNGRVVPTPIANIKWEEIIEKAVWRRPPFTYDPQNVDNEKGFRDSLVLETVRYICAQEARDVKVTFLCKDKLLRAAADSCLLSNSKFASYELVEDFRTYLELTKEKLKESFIRGIIKKASEKFFSKGISDTLFYRDKVIEKLKGKYSEYFDNPEKSEGDLSRLMFSGDIQTWEATGPWKNWISRAQFIETDKEGQYIWETPVTCVRQYLGENQPGSINRTRRVLILNFHISWRAKVGSDGRFWEYSYVSDKLEKNIFQEPSEEDKKHWELEDPRVPGTTK